MDIQKYFSEIKAQCGLSPEVLKSVWDKFSDDDPKTRVKRFSNYISTLTKSDRHVSFDAPSDSKIQEMARAMMYNDMLELKEAYEESILNY